MASPMSQLLVAVVDSRAIVRVCGRASFMCSADFKRLMQGLRQRGLRRFVLELGRCTIMDSTFLGILARFAQDQVAVGDGGRFVLWNPAPRILETLDNLGVAPLFAVEPAEEALLGSCEDVAPAPVDKLESTRLALEAHDTLAQLNPANAVRFKDVTAFLAEDLKRLEGTP